MHPVSTKCGSFGGLSSHLVSFARVLKSHCKAKFGKNTTGDSCTISIMYRLLLVWKYDSGLHSSGYNQECALPSHDV
jgi:hypothetical protein